MASSETQKRDVRNVGKQWGVTKVPRESDESYWARITAVMSGKPQPEPVLVQSRPKRWWLTFIWTWQADLITFLIVLLLRALWGCALFWRDGLWVELKYRCWPVLTWYKRYGGTTFLHGGMLRFGRKALPHELHHVEQGEARMLAGFILGLVSAVIALHSGSSIMHCIFALEVPWLGSWLVGYFASLAQAYLRGEDPYRGSHLEEAAYALTEDEQEEHL